MKSLNLHSLLKSTLLLASAATGLWFTSAACAQGTTVTSSIANNATGVALNVPMIFTFSKAINTSETSATFVEMSPSPGLVTVATSWTAGDTQLTCTPEGGTWPAQAQITWVLSATDIDGGAVTVPPFGIPPTGMFSTGTGGGTTDTNPPVLLSSTPTDHATSVPVNEAVEFSFNKAMQSSEAIEWSANLTAASFTYSWSADAKTLTCRYSPSFPTNATITWKLNPAGASTPFKDAAGNALPTGLYAGSFTTTCSSGPGDTSLGSFSLFRQVTYVQTGTADPLVDTDTLPSFGAILNSPTNANPVTSARLDVPGGSSIDLTNIPFVPRLFFSTEEYATQAALDASRPAGPYTLHVNRTTGGSQSLTLNLTANWPPTPKIQNWSVLQSANASSDLVVQWNGFTGAGQGDAIDFMLMLNGNEIYHAPDPCVPILLDKAATSITVPKGILEAGKTYDATLMYLHTGPVDTNTISDIPAIASMSKTLNFQIVTSSGTVGGPLTLTNTVILAGGAIQFTVSTTAGRTFSVETTPSLSAPNWTTLLTTNTTSGTVVVTDTLTGPGTQKIYRAKATN